MVNRALHWEKQCTRWVHENVVFSITFSKHYCLFMEIPNSCHFHLSNKCSPKYRGDCIFIPVTMWDFRDSGQERVWGWCTGWLAHRSQGAGAETGSGDKEVMGSAQALHVRSPDVQPLLKCTGFFFQENFSPPVWNENFFCSHRGVPSVGAHCLATAPCREEKICVWAACNGLLKEYRLFVLLQWTGACVLKAQN